MKGDMKEFLIWWICLTAFASANGCKLSIGERNASKILPDNAEVLDIITADERTMAEAKQKNKIAIVNLTMALVFDRMISLINTSMGTSWPRSLACQVVAALHSCFVPQGILSCVKM